MNPKPAATLQFSILQLDPDDAEPVAALHADNFSRPWPAEDFCRMLTGTGVIGLAAYTTKTGAEPVGFILARLIAGEAEILTLCVAADRRRNGCGASLVARLIEQLARRGGRSLFLEVAEDNAAAKALYRGQGFCEVGRRQNYYHRQDGPDGTALVLKRQIGPGSGETAPEGRARGTGRPRIVSAAS